MLDRVAKPLLEDDPRSCILQDVCLAVDGNQLLQSVNLEIISSGCTVILGPNGAGKSLLLRVMHALTLPTSGSVKWGKSAAGDATRNMQAMVFQKPVLLRRSVAANLDYVLDRTERANGFRAALLERVDLAGRERQSARVLSGGEQQRLALARALACKPKVLFLDEPSASLDPNSTHRIEQILLEERNAGTKIVLVTHDVGQARRLADDVVFIRKGKIEETASAQMFFEAPTSPYARQFLAGELVL